MAQFLWSYVFSPTNRSRQLVKVFLIAIHCEHLAKFVKFKTDLYVPTHCQTTGFPFNAMLLDHLVSVTSNDFEGFVVADGFHKAHRARVSV